MTLESDAQGEAEGASFVQRVGDLAEVGGRQVGPWLGELRSVQEVDGFRAEGQLVFLRHHKRTLKRRVDVGDLSLAEGVAAEAPVVPLSQSRGVA